MDIIKQDTESIREEFFISATQPFAILDEKLNFIDCNDEFLRLIPFTRKKLQNRNILEINPDLEGTHRHKAYLNVLKTGKSELIEDTFKITGVFNSLVRIKIFKMEKGLGIAIVDITDLKEAIDELETYMFKSSHDLRTPVLSMQGFVSLAKKEMELVGDQKEIRDVASTYFDYIFEQTKRLDFILSQLVNMVKLKSYDQNIAKINFEETVENVIHSLSFIEGFNQVKIKYEIQVNSYFFSDQYLLGLVFQNLLDNAIKYRKPESKDSQVKIDIKSVKNGVNIEISDNGIGIEKEFHSKIFNVFERATDISKGSGLGLFSVKNSIKKMGGVIDLESAKDEGTVFHIFLPNLK